LTTKKASSKSASAPKEATSMAELLARSGKKIQTFIQGQRVEATILSKSQTALVLDIGGKSEGIVTEKGYTDAKEFIETLKVGDKVLATVLVPETREGTTILALKDAIKDISWEKLIEAQKKGADIPVLGKMVGASGLTVDISGVEGFIPMSQLGKIALENTQSLVGKYFKAKVIEVDKSANKVVMSEKEVSEAGDIAAAKEALKKIKEGEIYDGVITTVAPFGAFVKISVGKASLEGLVHVSELSFSKVNLPSDVVSEGDKVKVRVLASREGKLAFSIKQAQKDPWGEVEKKYKLEDKITGKVMRISDFGAFVELEPGIEGLIHITKIPPTHKLSVGDDVKCVVEEIHSKDKRIALGLVLTSIPVGYK
jgi:ribosomal protein S1